jgi:hypothetical protein
MPVRRLTAALTLALACAAPLGAQEFLDAGTFVVQRGGMEAGREEFAIRPTTGRQGGNVLLVSTSRLPAREIQQALELASDHTPVSFQQTETAGGRVVRRVSAQLAGIRFSARIVSNEGETAREFPVRSPVAILGEESYADFYFVPRPEAGSSRTVSVVRAQDVRPVTGSVANLGPDTVRVAGRQVAAQRFALRLADGDERQFWFTAAGDLLQVAVPGADLVATRAELPRR